MHRTDSRTTGHRTLPRRRWVLLASAATIALATVLGGPPDLTSSATLLATPAQAAETAGPAGFADIVQKVKPAVVSVREGEARLVRRRETYADLMATDVWKELGGK